MLVHLLITAALSSSVARAHLAAWHKGMYCLNGNTGSINYNTDDVVHPLYQLTKDQWWFHHYNNVDQFPPADGDFIELPAGGSFTVEIASNRGETSLAFGGKYATDWPDGQNYPDDYNVDTCITSPNMHTQNQSRAAGTAFAIAYTSDITKVTEDNLAVFTVRYHTPWKRVTSYDVPAAMPACPPGGCICAWGWVPNGCGQPNMYHLPYRCKVTGATSTTPIGTAKAPVWCENSASGCTNGPKQMIYWNQLDGNNIEVSGLDAAGDFKSPAYNAKCGFADGAQNDIFTGKASSSSSSSGSGSSSGSSSSSSSSSSSDSSSSSSSSSGGKDNSSSASDSSSGAASNAGSAGSSQSSNAAAAAAAAAAAPSCKTRKKRRAEAEAFKAGIAKHRRGHLRDL